MSDLRVAVLGVGIMGADHVARISTRIAGARVDGRQRLPHREGRADRRGHPRLPRHRRSARRHRRPGRRRRRARHPGPDPREAAAGLPRARQAGAVREAADHRRGDVPRGRQARGRARHAADPGRLHAPVRPRIRPTEGAARRRRAGSRAGAALRAPQSRRTADVRQRDDRAGLAGPRGRRHPVPVRRGDRLDPDHQAVGQSRCTRRPRRPADRDHAHRVGQARRRRTVRHDRRRLRGAHRGGRREGQRDDRPGRRTGPQDRAGHVGRADHARLPRALRPGLRHRVPALGRRGAPRPAPATTPTARRLGRLRRVRGLRGRRRVVEQRAARRGGDGRPRDSIPGA